MSQAIFQQDEALAHTAAKTQRWCQVNFPDFYGRRAYDRESTQTCQSKNDRFPGQRRKDEPGGRYVTRAQLGGIDPPEVFFAMAKKWRRAAPPFFA